MTLTGWKNPRPLSGLSVVVTRPPHQAQELSHLLREAGARPVEVPTIVLREPSDWRPVDQALERVGEFDWITFTSANAVDAVRRRLARQGRDLSFLVGAKVAAIGEGTARALTASGLEPALVPSELRADALAEALGRAGVSGSRILLPRAAGARPVLPQRLTQLGAHVCEVHVYRAVPAPASPDRLRRLWTAKADVFTFTASSTVRAFAHLVGNQALAERGAGVRVATIGPITSGTARDLGIQVDIEAATYTLPGLVKAICEALGTATGRM
jgi:uroporphyrinogen III methyltransferase/synthase